MKNSEKWSFQKFFVWQNFVGFVLVRAIDRDEGEEEEERRKISSGEIFSIAAPGRETVARKKEPAAVCLLGRLGSGRNKEVGRERRIRSDSRRETT